MSHRPIIAPNPLKPLVDHVTTGADITPVPQILQFLPGVSYDIAWTGTTHGDLVVEVSNTYRQNADGSVASLGNWTVLPVASFSGTYPVPSGTPGNGFIDVVGTEAYACRIKFVRIDGTGTMTIVPCAKVL